MRAYILLIICILASCESQIFITVDDVTTDSVESILLTSEIIKFLENRSATFFVIPNQMTKYDFPQSIEIAQHGYTHRNKFSNREFLFLDRKEVRQRIQNGRATLQELGYSPCGFRAPGWSLKHEDLDLLENFSYDSSFFFSNNPLVVPTTSWDFSFFVCMEKSCNKALIGFNKRYLTILKKINGLLGRPTIINLHFQPLKQILDKQGGREYLNEILPKKSITLKEVYC